MPPNPRVAKAFRAMKAIGISEDKVKPVLKNLLQLFDKNWELIEEENYRALADAIFEREEAEAIEQSKKIGNNEEDYLEEEAQVNVEPERPVKRSRLRNQEGEASPSINNTSLPGTSLVILKEEQDELHEMCPQNQNQNQSQGIAYSPQPNTGKLTAESQAAVCQSLGQNKEELPVSPKSMMVQERCDPSWSSAVNKSQQTTRLRTESNLVSHPMRLGDRGKEALSPQIPSGERSSLAGRHKEPSLEPSIAVLPKQKTIISHVLIKDEPVTYDVSQLEVPIAVIQPDPSSKGESSSGNGSIRENNGPGLLASQSIGAKGTAEWDPISNETISNGEPAMVSDSLGAQGVRFNSLDGSVSSQFDGELVLPQGPQLSPPCDGVDGGTQLNRKAIENYCETNGENKENDLEDTNFQHVVVSQERQLPPERIRSLHDVDIAKGQEKVVITLVNEVNKKSLPSFFYIPKNAFFQNAHVNFSLARLGDNNCCATCSGDCLSLSMHCACSKESGGEFAYTTDGLIKEDFLKECISMNRDPEKHCQYFCKECPLERSKNEDIVGSCKGHLVRKFIKECWVKCGCNIHCGNRVVQRGISRKLQVFMTPGGKGWGLRTLEDLPKGAFVCEYVGEVLTNAELYDRVRSSKGEEHSYPVLLDADWGSEVVVKDEDALCLDATHYGNVARFINHRCFDSNVVEIPVEVETPDHHYYHLAFFTTRKVKAMEELTWDYGIDFDDHDHPVKAFRCQCGSRFCRSVKCPSRSRSLMR